MFNDYYVSADNAVGESDFERIERENYPEVKEENRIMQQIHYFGPERWKREGLAQGIEQGIERGIERGIEQVKREVLKRMLARSLPNEQICDLLQISARELAAIKRNINNKKR